jgi:hypothetical protein
MEGRDMNFFEQELGKAVSNTGLKNPVYAGRACYGNLGGGNRVKLEFVTLGHAHHYEALKATVLSTTEGVVDTLLFRFRDLWGKKYDLHHQDGMPHIWSSNERDEWHIYTPTDADFKQLGEEIKAYTSVFAIESPTREKVAPRSDERESVLKKLREADANPAPRKASPGKDHEPGL